MVVFRSQWWWHWQWLLGSGSPGERGRAKRQARGLSLVRLSWSLRATQQLFTTYGVDGHGLVVYLNPSQSSPCGRGPDWDTYTWRSPSETGEGQLEYPRWWFWFPWSVLGETEGDHGIGKFESMSVLVKLLLTWHRECWLRKMPLSDWPTGKFVGHFFFKSVMWKHRSYCGWCHQILL